MVSVYLSANGNAREMLAYYAGVFDAPEPYVMRFSDMPAEDQADSQGMEDLVIYGHVTTYAGNIMVSDNMPGQTTEPSGAVWINFADKDHDRLRTAFDRLARDGEVLMPIEPAFFSSLYGQVRDKFGFYWMLMADEEAEAPEPPDDQA